MALPKLPAYMERIRAHLLAERGMSETKATSTAIATCYRFCRSGTSPNLPVHVNAGSRAEACAAVAELQAMNAARKSEPAPKEQPVAETVTDKAWDGSASRFSDAEYARSCVLDRGPGAGPPKQRYSLPVREPDGALNRNGVHAAASRVGSVQASPEQIRAAASRLVALYRSPLKEEPPDDLVKLAGLAVVAGAVAGSDNKQKKQEARSMDELETRTIDVDVADLEQRGRTVHGYAAVYGTLSHDLGGYREKIAPGAFAEVLAGAPDVRALLNHDPSQVLGRTKSGTLRLFDEERGLRFELDLPSSPLGETVRESVARGDIDGASFRFGVGSDGQSWEGNTRTLTRIGQLLDCSLATFGAYPSASIELRTRPNEEDPVEHEDPVEIEQRAAGGLKVTDQNGGQTETRTLLDSFKHAGWTPGVRAEIGFDEFNATLEQRTLSFAGSVDDISILRREGVGLGMDRRYAWPAFGSVSVDAGTTSVQVLKQTSRSLGVAADLIRAIDSTDTKPQVDSELDLVDVAMRQVACVQSNVPNVLFESDQFRSVVGVDLRLAINEALDVLVLTAIASSGHQVPGSDPLIASIRKAMTVIEAAGYSPNVLILKPSDAEALDLLQTSGPEEFWVFGAANFAPSSLFGLNVRISKLAPAPVVADTSAFGKLYASPVSLANFEENAGSTNSQTVRLEGTAAFGVERQDAAVRIAAS